MDNNATGRLSTLGVSLDAVVIAQGDMDETPLISRHGRQVHVAMLTHGTVSSGLGNGENLVTTTALVSLHVNGNGVSEPKATAHEKGEQRLERFESLSMSTNQNRKIGRSDIKNQLALVSIVLIDRRVGGIKEPEDGAKDAHGYVGDGIELLVGKLSSGLVMLGNLSELSILASGQSRLGQFFRHGNLHL